MSDPSAPLDGRTVTCPYNLNHRVDPAIFADHLRACRLRYCRQSAQKLKLVSDFLRNHPTHLFMCRVNSRHFVPDVELEFHEKQCEDPLYRQIVAELKTEPVPIKIPSSDSSDSGDESDGDTTSVSSGDTDYSTSKDELLRRILEGPDTD
ncbi:hypothetical protein NECAME_11354 [Necator americanus]|uniref:CHHC U11-48K-type domain-containing protein n=1 Tax=Necator americanus TaxID=51031 RepID=W2T543_NECAM|nr:hypothetical protein NECAME_11354 [Necator americanus]ETN77033.1 hypothetical protein NECAME_11354 [Necator americanus]